MPRLLLPSSPCKRCRRLVCLDSTTYVFEEEGTNTVVALEYCCIREYEQFQAHRNGVKSGDTTGFPWCAFFKAVSDET